MDKRVSPAKDGLKMSSKLAALLNFYSIIKLMTSVRKTSKILVQRSVKVIDSPCGRKRVL